MTAHRHDWMMSDRPDVLECADCGACCTWDPSDRSTHPDAHMPADPLDAGVISSDAPIVLSPTDADRVAALIEELPGPTEAMRALFAERRPCAGWVATEIGSLVLRRSDGVGSHAVVHGLTWRTANASGSAPTLEAAQLAAEDALRAVGDPAGGGVVTLALVIDRFTRAGWSVTIAPGREPWAIRVEAWRMDGTDRVSAGNTTPRELLYAVADPSAAISDALVEIAGVLGVDVG